MKKLLLPVLAMSLFISSCGEGQKKEENKEVETVVEQLYYFGDTITTDGAEDASKLSELIAGKDTARVKLSGVINEVCQVKGCWMTMNIGEEEMRVRFKDYGFFMPKDASGKSVIIEGFAVRDTTSVEELRHYAEDAGESEEAINAINEPEISLSFEASGVIIKNEE